METINNSPATDQNNGQTIIIKQEVPQKNGVQETSYPRSDRYHHQRLGHSCHRYHQGCILQRNHVDVINGIFSKLNKYNPHQRKES